MYELFFFNHSAMNGNYSVLPIELLEKFHELSFKQSCQECRWRARSAFVLPWHLSLGDLGAVTASLTPRFSHSLSVVENHKLIHILVYTVYIDYAHTHTHIFNSSYYISCMCMCCC